MIVIYTRAYNAEATIRRTIDSILNQTYTDFRYVLFNNGSVDSTLDIMREYARIDKRIIILSTKLNQTSFNSCLSILYFIINNFSEDDYLCNIDADDVYKPDFFEKMITFAEDQRLDFVFSGYNILERNTGRLLESKSLSENLIMENEQLPEYFMTYRRYTTDMWAKLIKVSLLQHYLSEEYFEVQKDKNHTQQNFIYDALMNSCRVGFFAQCLMDYYESNISQKNVRMAGQISLIQSRDIFFIMKRFLEHFRTIDSKLQKRNISYIYAIYCGYIKDLIEVIKLTNAMSLQQKITYIFNIFSYYVTKDMLEMDASSEFFSLSKEAKEELCRDTISYVETQEGYEKYADKINMIKKCMQESGMCIEKESN